MCCREGSSKGSFKKKSVRGVLGVRANLREIVYALHISMVKRICFMP
jgi:hypothetical protein